MEAKLRFLVDRRNVIDGSEGGGALVCLWDVGIQEGQVKLDMLCLFKQLA